MGNQCRDDKIGVIMIIFSWPSKNSSSCTLH